MDHDASAGRFDGLELVEVATGLMFPEGPIAMADGSVVLVEIQRGTLSRVHPDGTIEVVVACGGGPNGAAIGPEDAVYLCNNGGYFDYADTSGFNVPTGGSARWTKGSIQRIEAGSGAVETLYSHCDGRPLLAPNDLVFDAHGGFWFTDHGVHAADVDPGASVLYAAADGSSIRGVVHGLDATNGVGLSPDGDRLYVSETYRGRLLAWDVDAPGSVVGPDAPTVLYDAGGAALFDSLAVTADGSVCLATLLSGGITVVAPDGGIEFVATGDPLTTNICFGGDDRGTAWITASGTGRLLRGEWPVAGLRLAY